MIKCTGLAPWEFGFPFPDSIPSPILKRTQRKESNFVEFDEEAEKVLCPVSYVGCEKTSKMSRPETIKKIGGSKFSNFSRLANLDRAKKRTSGSSTKRRRRCSAPYICHPREVDVRLPGKGNSKSHGARPVHLIIKMIKLVRASTLSINNYLSATRER